MKKHPSALDLFKCRRSEVPAPYFEYITVPSIPYNIKESVVKWIEQRLRGRFYVGETTELTANNSVEVTTKIGFEDGKELAYFVLACSLLKYN